MLNVLFLSKIYPACHYYAKGIKPGSNTKITDKHAAEYRKLCVFGHKLICLWCITCPCNNIAKSMNHLDILTSFSTLGFRAKIRKIYTPVHPRFTLQKWGTRGYKPYWHVIQMQNVNLRRRWKGAFYCYTHVQRKCNTHQMHLVVTFQKLWTKTLCIFITYDIAQKFQF